MQFWGERQSLFVCFCVCFCFVLFPQDHCFLRQTALYKHCCQNFRLLNCDKLAIWPRLPIHPPNWKKQLGCPILHRVNNWCWQDQAQSLWIDRKLANLRLPWRDTRGILNHIQKIWSICTVNKTNKFTHFCNSETSVEPINNCLWRMRSTTALQQ